MKRNTAQKIVIATAVMLAAGLGYLIIRLIVRHWRYVCPSSFKTIISLVVADFILQAVKGEEDFARTLEISKEDICKLDVAEGVSSRVDKTLASRNFGLSFCIPSL